MMLAGAVVIFGVALLLLSSWGDCGICPAMKEDVHLFLNGTSEEYVEYVKQYKDDPEILENTEKIKQCVDSTLMEEDKAHANGFIEKIEASPLC
ncbi:secretoglobin, family 1B, member 15 precursor [Mus musculus]|uniref:ABPA15_a17 n=3 Tax=Mus musculus TaxID=10090 RepID=A0A087WP50_MOUSE|nr:secretoglobin, family 1B, member 17 precursor [Mus musculus]NP_001357808.1 secretoglobin, family 1B, member 15 precursor [Mus musculus]AIQ80454.1 ABPA15_a17 [Mus musculus]QPF16757.1 ABPA10 [Mus musculus domesticus]QPZ87459.1 ABPA10 [Mus musculus musculus]|eukprot:XP_006540557.1 PREDICTED: major allergen I polypeptide chain 1-like [Mus musculus]